jgi:hypothetical protein
MGFSFFFLNQKVKKQKQETHGSTDLVCCRTLQVHTGKGFVMLSVLVARRYQVKDSPSLLQKTHLKEKPRTHCLFSAPQLTLFKVFSFLFFFLFFRICLVGGKIGKEQKVKQSFCPFGWFLEMSKKLKRKREKYRAF